MNTIIKNPKFVLSSIIVIAASYAVYATFFTAPTPLLPASQNTKAHWSYAGKSGIGTSYEQYTNEHYEDGGSTGKISKVWFSLAQGIITETMFGLIHEAQLQEAQFYIKGDNFLHQEKVDTITQIDYLDKDEQGRPLSLAYKIINRDKQGRYKIEKHIFTDPDTNTLSMKVYFHAFADNITPYLYINPSIANTAINDKVWSENNTWFASDENTYLAIKTDAKIIASTLGLEGVSDGLNDLHEFGKLKHPYLYNSAEIAKGTTAITLQMPNVNNNQKAEWFFTFGFGNSKEESARAATQTLATGYVKVLDNYNGKGDAIGWEDYLASLPELEKLSQTATDGGKLLYTSAMVLKSLEDKTHAGAVIASLSNPWGDTADASVSQTGYKAVWPRDFYQVTMAMLALGDKTTPKVAFEYLQTVQANSKTPGYTGTPGWFLQKTHVDGTPEWVSVQLDQTAMPIMLGWRLWKEGILSDAEITDWYKKMLQPAAEFLCEGGEVNIGHNHSTITPPFSQQERWEEQSGYSPSTIAAVITGLTAAADIANIAQDNINAKRYLAHADEYSATIEKLLFTTNGTLNTSPANGRYFLRVSKDTDPNNNSVIDDRNAQGASPKSEIVDAGFLELVRYGVRPANDNFITDSLPEIDNTQESDKLRVKYDFSFPNQTGTFPGWRRYGKDGYGEDTQKGEGFNADGNISPDGRGRVWPIFTGERGHYELAKASENTAGKIQPSDLENVRHTYVTAMELFANDGFMIPEQVWDGVGNNDTYHYTIGEGTNSATPLAWSHAEYIKLLRSISDKKVWDTNDSTVQRYRK